MAENSSNSGNNSILQSPFGRLEGVLGKEGLTKIFSGIGNGESGGTGGSKPDLAYGGNPFAGDNFWNIFAGGVNPSANGGSNLLLSNGNNSIPASGINPFAGDAGSGLQELIFDRLKSILGDNFFNGIDNTLAGGSNPFAGSGYPIPSGATNPFAGSSNPIAGAGSLLQQSPFDPLKEALGNNIPFSNGGNTSNLSSQTFNKDNAPIGNGNKDLGSNNATIGNFNSDYGSNSATIGNGNWNFNNDNVTIGNGNWLFGKSNITLGNGNWYWDDGSNNSTLGNGNWHFGSDNAIIGNGNWDFGTNNTIIGNGNWVFSSGNEIIGNGNWLANTDNTKIGNVNNISSLNLSQLGIKTDVNNLIDSLIGKIGQNFLGLAGDFDVSSSQTFNRLISSKSVGNDTNISGDIEQLLASLSPIQGNFINYQTVQSPQPVPESVSSASLVLMGLMCLLLSLFKKQQHC
ncbi:hypothetical protein [Nostoc sp. FACHB-133]|uniref:hypothetical protein n=1 Tax=Nostoc sp. FACHB-133 TaxID=2692835 RepID=UPI001683B630|nr:hypothetical protein [Nostoc sp. FACHB-133]MBD2527437.1 hypothetical protein [Nostoc sp. FACHB-133]